PIPQGEPALWTPLSELTELRSNCGIAEAIRQNQEVSVVIGCNDEKAATDRRVQLLLADEGSEEPLDERPLETRSGLHYITFTKATRDFELRVALAGSDAIVADNGAAVSNEAAELTLAVVADRTKASAVTGGAPLVEQALGALAPEVGLRP